jgi:hypothetical protein
MPFQKLDCRFVIQGIPLMGDFGPMKSPQRELTLPALDIQELHDDF